MQVDTYLTTLDRKEKLNGFKIGVGIDTVADLTPHILKQLNKIYSNLKKRDLKESIVDLGFTTQSGMDKILNSFQYTKEYQRMSPIKGALRGIDKLSKNHEIHFLTTRNAYQTVHSDTYSWLRRNGFIFDSLTTNTSKTKYKQAKRWKLDYMIDDNPDVIDFLSDRYIQCIVFDQPWNKKVKENEIVKRCKNWGQINKFIKKRLEE